MAEHSKIEWTEATWNPTRGCSMAKGSENGGCLNCYAARMAARGLPGLLSPTTGQPFAIMRDSGPRWTGAVELIESQLDVPLRWRRPRRIFVDSMSDLFHEALPDESIRRVFQVICECRGRHTFQILTKRADRMPKFFEWMRQTEPGWFHPETGLLDLWGTWLGTSVENRRSLWRIDALRETPAAVRFLSVEPLLEDLGQLDLTGIHWVIVGGESGPGARPMHPDWARSVRDQCIAAGVPFFFKQWGEFVPLSEAFDYYRDGRSVKNNSTFVRALRNYAKRQGASDLIDPEALDEGRISSCILYGTAAIGRVGKKSAGRLLDGREWSEMPKEATNA